MIFFTNVSEYLTHYFALIHLLGWENVQKVEGLVFIKTNFTQILLCNTVRSLVAHLCYFWFNSARGTWARKANTADETCDYLLLVTQRSGTQVGCVCWENVQHYFLMGSRRKSSE